ncbi:DNA pilot protein [Flyfo microvirus Tbat2_144]|nr:DNA pilot protein [Flyfo microvirus Tbat2_144]
MLGLLAPFLGGAASGLFGMFGAQQSASASRRAAMINAQTQLNINAQNAAMQAAANAQSQAQWNKAFRTSRADLATARRDARAATQLEIKQANIDRAIQRDFAQHGVQWRADDARATGIHPLAAMGAQLSTPSPIQISGHTASSSGAPAASNFGVSPGVAPQYNPSDPRGQALSNMGQDISRAITASATEYQRQQEVNNASQVLSLENQSLQNQLLAAQIARVRGAAVGPAFPSVRGNFIAGQGNSGARVPVIVPDQIKLAPAEVDSPSGRNSGYVAGVNPSTQTFLTPSGGYANEKSQKYAEATEDQPWPFNWAFELRERIPPTLTFGMVGTPPAAMPPREGSVRMYEPWYQQWRYITDPRDTWRSFRRTFLPPGVIP